MNCKFLKIIGIGFILSVSTLANATLIDNGDYTTDTVSGLDWLDWTKTLNYTQSEALDEYSVAGWRIATEAEAKGLILNHFMYTMLDQNGRVLTDSINDFYMKHGQFAALFGTTLVNPNFSIAEGSHAIIEGVGLIGSEYSRNLVEHGLLTMHLVGRRLPGWYYRGCAGDGHECIRTFNHRSIWIRTCWYWICT